MRWSITLVVRSFWFRPPRRTPRESCPRAGAGRERFPDTAGPREGAPVSDRELARDPLPRLRCWHCQDVIGAYEPMVLETRLGRSDTSLAAEPWLYDTDQPCFHRACYAQARGDGG